MFLPSSQTIRAIESFMHDDYIFLHRKALPICLHNVYKSDDNITCMSWSRSILNTSIRKYYVYSNAKMLGVFLNGYYSYSWLNTMELRHDLFRVKVFPGVVWDANNSDLLMVGVADTVDFSKQEVYICSKVYFEQYKPMKKAVADTLQAAVDRKIPIHILPDLNKEFVDLVNVPTFEDFSEEAEYYETLLPTFNPF